MYEIKSWMQATWMDKIRATVMKEEVKVNS